MYGTLDDSKQLVPLLAHIFLRMAEQIDLGVFYGTPAITPSLSVETEVPISVLNFIR